MAAPETWAKLRHFHRQENWGDPDLISDELLLILDDFRHFMETPMIVTAGVAKKGHSKNSFHYPENGACAVDIVLPRYTQLPIDLLLAVSRFPFTGIGYYTNWKLRGSYVPGLHLDTRPLKWDADDTKNYMHNRWIGAEIHGKQQYFPWDYATLKMFGG